MGSAASSSSVDFGTDHSNNTSGDSSLWVVVLVVAFLAVALLVNRSKGDK